MGPGGVRCIYLATCILSWFPGYFYVYCCHMAMPMRLCSVMTAMVREVLWMSGQKTPATEIFPVADSVVITASIWQQAPRQRRVLSAIPEVPGIHRDIVMDSLKSPAKSTHHCLSQPTTTLPPHFPRPQHPP